MPLTLHFSFAIVLLLSWMTLKVFQRRGKGLFPPGPPSDPIIGHLRLMLQPGDDAMFHEWHKRYGDVVHLNVLSKHVIFLNSDKVARDLLDKRSIIYSDRPYFPVHEMIGWENMLGFLPYGEQFHKTRKLFQDSLSRRGVTIFEDIQLHQAHVFLDNLLHSPHDFSAHVKSAVILEIAHGHRVESIDDSYLDLSEQLNSVVAGLGGAGVSVVDFLPILRYLPSWFPGASLHRRCEWSKTVIRKIQEIPFAEVRQKMTAGNVERSFLSMALENLERENNVREEELKILKSSSLQFYAAGVETTWSTIENLLAILLLHPDVQRKAQAEIDEVLGQKRLPNFGDRESLPYVNCVIQESARWHPTLPSGGIAHRVMEDDAYNGMLIPKGSTIVINSRCIAMDERVYQSPHTFYPERYLPKPEGYGEPFLGSTFGYGRRICPGRHLAEGSVWIAIATFLATFRMSPGKDESGNLITPKAAFSSGIASRPISYKCTIRPRSQRAQDLIERI